MSHQQVEDWSHVVERCRQRPAMCLGISETAHIERGIIDPLWMAGPLKALQRVRRTVIRTSSICFRTQIFGGQLDQGFADKIRRLSPDNLADACWQAGWMSRSTASREQNSDWYSKYSNNHQHEGGFAGLLILASDGALAIRDGSRLRWQRFEQGTPKFSPMELEDSSDTSFLLTATLSPEWFPGLPFVLDDVTAAIPPFACDVDLAYVGRDDAHSQYLLEIPDDDPLEISKYLHGTVDQRRSDIKGTGDSPS